MYMRPEVGVSVSGLKREVQVVQAGCSELEFSSFLQELFCCGSHSQTLLEGLSQVTVGVLFPVNSLQIFFLDQNVNAFLNYGHPRLEP